MVDRQPTPGVHEHIADAAESPVPVSHVVTEAEIEAALKGWHDAITNAPDEGVDERRRRCIRAALMAARSAPAQIAAPQANEETGR